MSYIYANPFIKPIGPMKKFTAFVLLFGVFVGFGLEQTQAQTQIELGPRLGFDIAGDVEEFFGSWNFLVEVSHRGTNCALHLQQRKPMSACFSHIPLGWTQANKPLQPAI